MRELSDVVDIESKHDAELGSEYEDILGILEPVYFSFFFNMYMHNDGVREKLMSIYI